MTDDKLDRLNELRRTIDEYEEAIHALESPSPTVRKPFLVRVKEKTFLNYSYADHKKEIELCEDVMFDLMESMIKRKERLEQLYRESE